MDMTTIKSCSVTNCAYNKHQSCHTLAITVGGPSEGAFCDTFFGTTQKGGIIDTRGGVGACKMAECKHNDSLECQAGSITVGWQKDHADCQTYAARRS